MRTALALLPLGLCLSASVAADYLAHAVGEQSRQPLPESLADIDARYLLELDWSYRGGRSTIDVRPVEVAGGVDDASSGEGVPAQAIHGVISEALRRTGRFDVDVDEGADAADYVLQVTVAAYQAEAAVRITNPRAGGARRAQAAKGRVALRMRLVNAADALLLADRFEALVEQPRAEFASHGAVEGLPADVWRTPIGQAMLAAVNQGTFEVVKAAGPLAPTGRVVKAEDSRVWVNLGAGILSVGDELIVTAEGEALVDPETGLNLGGPAIEVAKLLVTQAEARFSIAEMLSATGTPSRGDTVVPASPPSGFEFAPRWEAPADGEF
ncbi:MAG: hypothetical protein OXU70_17665 [Gammaproteobacteria bacterium]|nr:hypothetical protein [Gammaproteobacteria bacterium]